MEEKQEEIICEEEEQEKASEALDEILATLNKFSLRVEELVLLYSNLGYSIGASIDGIGANDEKPSLESLQQKYYEKPSIGVALMLQGLLTSTWVDDFKQKDKKND